MPTDKNKSRVFLDCEIGVDPGLIIDGLSCDYKDFDGNDISLDKLCRKDPEWAANVIRTLKAILKRVMDEGIAEPEPFDDDEWDNLVDTDNGINN